jgi:hypothetical protein
MLRSGAAVGGVIRLSTVTASTSIFVNAYRRLVAGSIESMEMLGIRLPQVAPRPPYRDTIA